VAQGTYFWNSGIFIWQLSTLMDAFSRHVPDLYRQLTQIEQALNAGQPFEAPWEAIDPISIDVGIMERAEKVAVIPVDFGWNDVGSWAAIHEVGHKDAQGNVVRGSNTLLVNTANSYVQAADRFLAVVGLDDVVVVDTGDALLICAKEEAQDVKEVVNWLEDNHREELL
jgi:mannose-1-phosphate guanylyltransferase